MSTAGRDALIAMLSRLRSDLVGLNLGKPEVARAALQAKHPLTGDYLTEVLRLCQRGLGAGWLCDVEEVPGVRKSRLTGPAKHFPFAVDAYQVAPVRWGATHWHPKGKVLLSWGVDGRPSFCGVDPGWLVFAPGGKHAPDVKGGTVFFLAFLPGGAFESEIDKKILASLARAAGKSAASGARAAAQQQRASTSPTAAGPRPRSSAAQVQPAPARAASNRAAR